MLLFSQGFQSAERLAGRAVMLFDLCHQQLSSQPHYDFGLRALKSVLVSAGNIKRMACDAAGAASVVAASLTAEETDASELAVLMRSISETVAPKLVALDLPVFESLMAGVFPGSKVQPNGVRHTCLRSVNRHTLPRAVVAHCVNRSSTLSLLQCS